MEYRKYPMEHYRTKEEVFLRTLDELLQQRTYPVADHVSLADMPLAPFIRQFAHVDREWFAQTPSRHL